MIILHWLLATVALHEVRAHVLIIESTELPVVATYISLLESELVVAPHCVVRPLTILIPVLGGPVYPWELFGRLLVEALSVILKMLLKGVTGQASVNVLWRPKVLQYVLHVLVGSARVGHDSSEQLLVGYPTLTATVASLNPHSFQVVGGVDEVEA